VWFGLSFVGDAGDPSSIKLRATRLTSSIVQLLRLQTRKPDKLCEIVMQPSLSVIIPSYNRADVLGRAVGSVLGQSGPDIEVIVVDDGSTDDTAILLASYEDPRLRIVVQANAGVCAARNAGVQASSARFLAFLDSDDEAAAGWVDFYRAAAMDSLDFASCGVRHVSSGSDDQVLTPNPHGPQFGYIEARFLPGAFGLAKDLLIEVGGFRVGLRYSEHTDLALRLGGRVLDKPIRSRRTDEPLVIWYRDDRPYNAEVRYTSAMTILREDAVHLKRSPRLHATYAAIAGVAASKMGQPREARRLLVDAIRLQPLDWRNYIRWTRELLPRRQMADEVTDTKAGT
jgi:glycosyltransferase involved in cell wall biosynthesis